MPPCFQDLGSDGDAPPAAAAVPGGAHLLGFSDEILLHILSHIPSTDLVLHVRRTCRKLAELCLDKSLTHTVLLQKDYEVRRGRWAGPVCGREMGDSRTPGCTQGHRAAVDSGAGAQDPTGTCSKVHHATKAGGRKVQEACHPGEGASIGDIVLGGPGLRGRPPSGRSPRAGLPSRGRCGNRL